MLNLKVCTFKIFYFYKLLSSHFNFDCSRKTESWNKNSLLNLVSKKQSRDSYFKLFHVSNAKVEKLFSSTYFYKEKIKSVHATSPTNRQSS